MKGLVSPVMILLRWEKERCNISVFAARPVPSTLVPRASLLSKAFSLFNMPWHYQICFSKDIYSDRDHLPKHLASPLPVDVRHLASVAGAWK